MKREKKKIIILNGANLCGGGALSVLRSCLRYASKNLTDNYKVIALVSDVSFFSDAVGITFIELKSVKKSYVHRLYYEFITYKKLSKKWKPYLWLSLNDISSNVVAEIKAVYCHNASPFRKTTLTDTIDDIKLFFSSLLFRYIHFFNIHSNDFVIVQQRWIKEYFVQKHNLLPEKVIIARPDDALINFQDNKESVSNQTLFFYPVMARPFKNFEIIVDASKILLKRGISDFNVVLTISGNENSYARRIKKRAKGIKNIDFAGTLDIKDVEFYYQRATCLLFSSKLETWGLPITEFKHYGKPILLADLPYARETLGKYDKAVFFDPNCAENLANIMQKAVESDELIFDKNTEIVFEQPFSNNWQQLFQILLNKK